MGDAVGAADSVDTGGGQASGGVADEQGVGYEDRDGCRRVARKLPRCDLKGSAGAGHVVDQHEMAVAAVGPIEMDPHIAVTKPLLRGEETVDLARPRPTPPRRSPAPGGGKRKRRSEPPVAPADMDAFEALRGLRGEIAREQGGPAYRIFTDATLREICRTRPRDAASLLAVSGVGPTKLERYGPRFLACLAALGEDPGL